MKKTKGLWLLIHLLVIGVFNIIFFLVKGTDNPASVWLSYGLIHFAYIVTWMLSFKAVPRASLFGMAFLTAVHTYFWVEFIVGIIFIVLSLEGWKLAFITQLLVFFVFALPAIFSQISGEYAKEGEKTLKDLSDKAQKTTDYIKMAKSKVYVLLKATTDMELKMKVQEVYDLFESGSIPATANSSKTLDLITEFGAAVASKNIENTENIKGQLLEVLK